MRTRTLFPLALAVLAMACEPRPTEPGGAAEPKPAPQAPEHGPGLIAPPAGGLASLADSCGDNNGGNGHDPEEDPDDQGFCPLDGWVSDVCEVYGEVYDPDTEDCQCREGFERDDTGYCGFDWPDPPSIGGPRIEVVGGGGGGGGDDGDDDGDDDDTEEEERLDVELSCTPDVVSRANMVSCEATSDNAIGTTSYEWLFRPKDGGVQIWDHGPPQKLSAVQGDDGVGDTWEGLMVAGGKVSVIVLDSTRFASTAAEVSVTPRSGWTVRQPGFERGPDLENVLVLGALFGLNTTRSGSDDHTDILKGHSNLDAVMSGPNKGYGYVDSESYNIGLRQWRINKRLTPKGPAEVPHGKRKWTHWDYVKYVGGYDPKLVRSGVEAHEGRGQPGKGHQGQIEKALNTSTCKDAAGIAERVVADDVDEALRIVQRIRAEADKAFGHSTWHYYVHSNYRGYVVFYDPADTTVAPQLASRTDVKDPRSVYSPGPGCRWGVF